MFLNTQYLCTACGGLIENSDSGFIRSPGFPLGYPDGSNCTWTVSALSGRTVRLSFSSPFSVRGQSACIPADSDYVEVSRDFCVDFCGIIFGIETTFDTISLLATAARDTYTTKISSEMLFLMMHIMLQYTHNHLRRFCSLMAIAEIH